jgi:hypothetical protein
MHPRPRRFKRSYPDLEEIISDPQTLPFRIGYAGTRIYRWGRVLVRRKVLQYIDWFGLALETHFFKILYPKPDMNKKFKKYGTVENRNKLTLGRSDYNSFIN